VQMVRRKPGAGVTLFMADGQQLQFDQIVFACHSDQALKILERPSVAEQAVLGAIPYQTNDVVLHTDTRMLPRNKKTWSSWNYTLGQSSERSVVTYNMNILQGITAPETFCVTLNNNDAINPHKILGAFQYDHPVFSLQASAAQDRWNEINGVEDTWYCGAYWKNGFHEDGVVSALRVANAIDQRERVAA
jgi:predicted NAD/FAD-binding protein